MNNITLSEVGTVPLLENYTVDIQSKINKSAITFGNFYLG